MVFPAPDPNILNQRHKIGVREWEYKGDRWELATDLGIGGNHYYGDTMPNTTLKGTLWTDASTLVTYTYNGSEWTEVGRGTVS